METDAELLKQIASQSAEPRGRSRKPRETLIAPIVNFTTYEGDGQPNTDAPPPKSNGARKKQVAMSDDVVQQIAARANVGPRQEALAHPIPQNKARAKGQAKGKRSKGGLATIMEYNDVADDPYVMRPKVQ